MSIIEFFLKIFQYIKKKLSCNKIEETDLNIDTHIKIPIKTSYICCSNNKKDDHSCHINN